MNDRFKFRVWYDPECDGIKPRYFYDVEDVYDGSIEELGWISCFGDLLNDQQYTIEQCTGISDANDILIYEGDIVQTITGAIGEVRWLNSGFVAVYSGNLITFSAVCGTMKVIGNIHDKEVEK